MDSIAIYGKGGIGKSMVATNLSVCFSRAGLKVLHIGCDPKHDSSVRLVDPGQKVRTVLDILGERPHGATTGDVIFTGRLGISCCESGGPEPGVGCAGRGVARTLEFLRDAQVFSQGGFQMVTYDVLGDVVCGGFAAPLRAGFARKVYIVTSEEPMSLYAANNICKAVRTYSDNGVVLGGLIANLRNNQTDRDPLRVFASLLNTEILAFIPRDELILDAEHNFQTVVEYAPENETSQTFCGLAERIVAMEASQLELPSPLDDDEFFKFIMEMRLDRERGGT